jgi:putative ABC transport system permease protein
MNWAHIVVGVVNDYHQVSLKKKIDPTFFVCSKYDGEYYSIRLNTSDLPGTVDHVRDAWMKAFPGNPFEYFFLDDRFNEQYKEDEIQFKLLSNLSYICIFISLLGLLGLSAFTATQRTKEIGIRKVHGASIPQIIYLLYKDVMVLVVIAAVLVVPVGYYVMNNWLGNFAYQQPINFMIFALVAVLALIFAFLTVGFHSLKTARTNPVDSLKYE